MDIALILFAFLAGMGVMAVGFGIGEYYEAKGEVLKCQCHDKE